MMGPQSQLQIQHLQIMKIVAIYLNTYSGANAEIIDSTFTNNYQGIDSNAYGDGSSITITNTEFTDHEDRAIDLLCLER